MNVKDMNDELNILKLKVIHKTTGANVHKAENLLGSARTIITEYGRAKDEAWLELYFKAKKEIIKFISS